MKIAMLMSFSLPLLSGSGLLFLGGGVGESRQPNPNIFATVCID